METQHDSSIAPQPSEKTPIVRPLYVLHEIIPWEKMVIRANDEKMVLNGDEMNSVGFMPVYDSKEELYFHHGEEAQYIEVEGILIEEEDVDDTQNAS